MTALADAGDRAVAPNLVRDGRLAGRRETRASQAWLMDPTLAELERDLRDAIADVRIAEATLGFLPDGLDRELMEQTVERLKAIADQKRPDLRRSGVDIG